MNSDKAADVVQSINALPCVVQDPEPREYSGEPLTTHQGGLEVTFTGEHVNLYDYRFKPARMIVSGEVGFGDDPAMRPNYEVVVPALNLPADVHAYVPRDVVYEAAKHDCLIRCGEDGSLRLRDDMQHREESHADGDRCQDCGCTRFRLQDGVPECERCGATHEVAIEESEHELTIGDFAGGEADG